MADKQDIRANELLVTGALHGLLWSEDAVDRCEIVFDEEGNAQTAIHIWLDFMKSRYRITVTMDPED